MPVPVSAIRSSTLPSLAPKAKAPPKAAFGRISPATVGGIPERPLVSATGNAAPISCSTVDPTGDSVADSCNAARSMSIATPVESPGVRLPLIQPKISSLVLKVAPCKRLLTIGLVQAPSSIAFKVDSPSSVSLLSNLASVRASRYSLRRSKAFELASAIT